MTSPRNAFLGTRVSNETYTALKNLSKQKGKPLSAVAAEVLRKGLKS